MGIEFLGRGLAADDVRELADDIGIGGSCLAGLQDGSVATFAINDESLVSVGLGVCQRRCSTGSRVGEVCRGEENRGGFAVFGNCVEDEGALARDSRN